MKKINWSVRLKNPQFLIATLAQIGTIVFAYYGITGAELATWTSLWNLIVDCFSNPYVLGLIAVGLYNGFPDFTTKGLGDSKRALGYKKPHDGKDDE